MNDFLCLFIVLSCCLLDCAALRRVLGVAGIARMRPAFLFLPLSEVQLVELPVIGFVPLPCEPVFGCPDHLPCRVESLQEELDATVTVGG